MTLAERWMLPDGITEILPADASRIETLRRRLLDLYHSWGYDLVIPPMVEFTDSLLIGLGRDIELSTFRVTDQISGRMMGIRADITPQTARIDAHSFPRSGANRLCYAGHVLHTRPRTPHGSRAPIQTGAELYGNGSLDADIEIISLMLETLAAAGIDEVHLDLGHVAIFRSIIARAGLDEEREAELFRLVQDKVQTELGSWLEQHVADADLRTWLLALPGLHGGREVLENAAGALAGAPTEVSEALQELTRVAGVIAQRYPQTRLFFDLGELRGYDYESGLVFAAYTPGHGHAVANGGRYDGIGAVFGRARPATGFSTDLSLLGSLGTVAFSEPGIILAPVEADPELWALVAELRQSGERVISELGDDPELRQRCDRQLVREDGKWRLVPL